MALTATDAAPVRNANRPEFYHSIKMMSGDQIVPVFVQDAALEKLASSENNSGTPSEILSVYRSKIEEVASRKHSAGKIERDGSVWVTPADV